MGMLCNECEVTGKKRAIKCNHTKEPCVFIRYCHVSGKYYQTDGAATCRLKGKSNGENKERDAADTSDRIEL